MTLHCRINRCHPKWCTDDFLNRQVRSLVSQRACDCLIVFSPRLSFSFNFRAPSFFPTQSNETFPATQSLLNISGKVFLYYLLSCTLITPDYTHYLPDWINLAWNSTHDAHGPSCYLPLYWSFFLLLCLCKSLAVVSLKLGFYLNEHSAY